MSAARRTALFSFGAALALVAVKLLVGYLTGSLGILAEAVHSGVDAAAALLTLFAIGVAERPADHDHPYGHDKAQNLSALAEAAILVLAAVWIAVSAIVRLTGDGGTIDATWYAAAMLGLVLVIDATRATTSHRMAERERSAALGANAVHFAADFAGTLAVMAGLGLTALGHPRADSLAALFVGCLVVYGAIRLARSNVNALMDTAPAGAEANLRTVVASLPGVTEVRALRVRSSGGKYFADVVIGVDRLAGLERSHAVMDEVERVVEHELGGPAEVSVHAEPLAADERPSERVVAAALRVAGVIEVHNATVLMRPGGRAITLHARVDAGLPLAEAASITQRLRAEIRRETGAADVYIHLEPHTPDVTAAFDVTGRRRDLRDAVAEAVRPIAGEPEEVLVFEHLGRFVVVLRVRAVAGQSVADAHALAGQVEEAVRAAIGELEEVVVEVDP
ncbi:MAG TPA: cation diffusion facilitator family transporter [Gaiellales bacterium]